MENQKQYKQYAAHQFTTISKHR